MAGGDGAGIKDVAHLSNPISVDVLGAQTVGDGVLRPEESASCTVRPGVGERGRATGQGRRSTDETRRPSWGARGAESRERAGGDLGSKDPESHEGDGKGDDARSDE